MPKPGAPRLPFPGSIGSISGPVTTAGNLTTNRSTVGAANNQTVKDGTLDQEPIAANATVIHPPDAQATAVAVTFRAGTGPAAGNGGAVTLTGSDGGATSGNGGAATLQGGAATEGDGGAVNVTGRNAATAGATNHSGGSVTINAGQSTGASAGGNVVSSAGRGGATGNGGVWSLNGGNGGATSGNGGAITLTGGTPTDGNGGGVQIIGRNAATTTAANRNGGSVSLTAGNATNAGGAGGIVFTAGVGGSTSTGGLITMTAGQGGSTSGAGGAVTINGGAAAAGNSNGGGVNLNGGARNGTGVNGSLNLGLSNTMGVNYPVASPAQITANQDDYTGTDNCVYARLDTDASRNITSIANPSGGRRLVIVNVGANPLVLVHQAATGTAANRIIVAGAVVLGVTLAADQSAELFYDATTARWRVLNTNGVIT